MEPYLFDQNLKITKIIRIIGMSRTDLHRKLKSTIGMSTSEFIRFVRIYRAAHLLLHKPDLRICEVALEVGFNNQAYFSKRFREITGVTPLEYKKGRGNAPQLIINEQIDKLTKLIQTRFSN
ncbi:MAG: AraC family transcriptional regulator [Saprospiraceae bacterium]|nr:AraC family transcriptional regulator [Saprospiraceae bacterium]